MHDNEVGHHALSVGGEVKRAFWTYSEGERRTKRPKIILETLEALT